MSTVQPIRARQTGELARLLEERERGADDFQLLVEKVDEVVVFIDSLRGRKSKLLGDPTVVIIPAIQSFDPKAHFRVGETDGVKVGWTNGDFEKIIAKSVIEMESPEARLKLSLLLKPSLDGPVIAELGGEEAVETAWGQTWEMLKAQGHGQKGPLLTNGNANVFYPRGARGWAVYCGWSSASGGWSLSAYPVTSWYPWSAGNLFVSSIPAL